jgi:hypothetical protein
LHPGVTAGINDGREAGAHPDAPFLIATFANFCHGHGAGASWAVLDLLKEWGGVSERNE